MPINARISLASLLLIAAPIGCSEKQPAAEPVAPAPVVSAGPASDVMPAADPAAHPASFEPTRLEPMPTDGLKQIQVGADTTARQVVGEVKDQVQATVGELNESTAQAKVDARKMIDRARRDAREKAKSVGDKVKQDAGDLKKQVVEDLLGTPKN